MLLTLVGLRSFEKRVFKENYRILEITGTHRAGLVGEIGVLLGKYDIIIKDISLTNDDLLMTAYIQIKIPSGLNFNSFLHEIHNIEGIFNVQLIGEEVNISD